MPTLTAEETLNVVILYDNHAAGDRAIALYRELTRDLAGEYEPALALWRFDMATAPELAPIARREIASADLILVAVHDRPPGPPDRWWGAPPASPPDASQRRALVAVLEVEGKSCAPSCAWMELLRPTVALRPTDMLVWESPAHEPLAPSAESPARERAAPVGEEREPGATGSLALAPGGSGGR